MNDSPSVKRKSPLLRFSVVAVILAGLYLEVCTTKYIKHSYNAAVQINDEFLLQFELVGDYQDGNRHNVVIQESPYFLRLELTSTQYDDFNAVIEDGSFIAEMSERSVDISEILGKEKNSDITHFDAPTVIFVQDDLDLDPENYDIKLSLKVCKEQECEDFNVRTSLRLMKNKSRKNTVMEGFSST